MDILVKNIMTNFEAEVGLLKAKKPNKIEEYFKSKNVTGFKQIKMKDGSIAYGVGVKESLKGPVIIKFVNKTFYIGNMENGKRTGFGYRSYTDPTLFYVGEYKNDLKNGNGKIWNSKKQKWVFDGQWLNDKKNGFGTLVRDEGTYAGNWVDDKMEGKGKMVWINGDEFEGDFKQDIRNGYGVMKYQNGDEYKGEFKNGLINGFGTYLWKNGERYEGQFTDGALNDSSKVEYVGAEYMEVALHKSALNRNKVATD
jgi:hypothetical protein